MCSCDIETCDLREIIGRMPFSFVLGGVPSQEFLTSWQSSEKYRTDDNGTSVRVISYQDARAGLRVQMEAVEYCDFPAVEWVLRFENIGQQPTDIIEQIMAIDHIFANAEGYYPTSSCLRGSFGSRRDFAPVESAFWPGKSQRFSCVEGRSSCGESFDREDGIMPVFDIKFREHTLICAIGWTGQWQAEVQRPRDAEFQIQAGMEGCHLRLLPGETIRSPRILLFSHAEEPETVRNSYRQFILKHKTPLIDGKPAQGPLAACGWCEYRCGNDVS